MKPKPILFGYPTFNADRLNMEMLTGVLKFFAVLFSFSFSADTNPCADAHLCEQRRCNSI